MGTLLEGNVDNNNIIDITDFSIMVLSFNKPSTDPDYEVMADFNKDGIVNISDVSLLASNFGKNSPQTSP